MKSFGTILKEAREAKGLTCSQVAHDTHMLVQIVEEMEREDFHRIPAPIYGRGFVRLYAERVGLDPAPLITEFMEIFNGRKPPMSVRPAPAAAVPPPPPPPVSEPDPVPPENSEPPRVFNEISQTVPEPAAEYVAVPPPEPATAEPEPETEVPPSLRGLDLFDPNVPPPAMPPPPPPPKGWESPFASAYTENAEPVTERNAAKRFSEGLSNVSHSVIGRVPHIPRNAWRVALLAAGALAVVSLIVWGCVALYGATSSTDAPSVDETPVAAKSPETEKAPKPPAPGELKSTGPAIEPLYID